MSGTMSDQELNLLKAVHAEAMTALAQAELEVGNSRMVGTQAEYEAGSQAMMVACDRDKDARKALAGYECP